MSKGLAFVSKEEEEGVKIEKEEEEEEEEEERGCLPDNNNTPICNNSRAGNYYFCKKLCPEKEVYQATQIQTRKQVVVKVLKKRKALDGSGGERGPRRKEAKIHRDLQHPHIIPFEGVIETPDKLCIITEFAKGGDLAELVQRRGRKMGIEEVRKTFKQIAEALEYLHKKKGVAHRDIKPDNIFLNEEGEVQLGDFGLACKFGEGRKLKSRVCGTQGYHAPCMLKEDVAYVGPEVDCWGLGVCLFYLLQGRNPFEAPSSFQSLKRIRRAKYYWDGEARCVAEESARALVGRLLVVDTNARATIDEVMQHPWVRGIERINFASEHFVRRRRASSDLGSPKNGKKSKHAPLRKRSRNISLSSILE